MYNILVVGNGFDLAHRLKTSYEVFYTSYNYLEYNKSYLFSEEVESLIIQKNVYRLILRCHRRKLAIMDINVKLTVDKLLLDKISDAMGWIAMESTPSKIATTTYIDEIKSMDTPPLEKAAQYT